MRQPDDLIDEVTLETSRRKLFDWKQLKQSRQEKIAVQSKHVIGPVKPVMFEDADAADKISYGSDDGSDDQEESINE